MGARSRIHWLTTFRLISLPWVMLHARSGAPSIDNNCDLASCLQDLAQRRRGNESSLCLRVSARDNFTDPTSDLSRALTIGKMGARSIETRRHGGHRVKIEDLLCATPNLCVSNFFSAARKCPSTHGRSPRRQLAGRTAALEICLDRLWSATIGERAIRVGLLHRCRDAPRNHGMDRSRRPAVFPMDDQSRRPRSSQPFAE